MRGKIRIVLLGAALSLMPLITLTILPDALLQKQIISVSISFLFLGLLPVTYGYVIIRHRLIEFDRHVNRGATLILVFTILVAIYVGLSAIPRILNLQILQRSELINAMLVLILASVISPVYRRVQRLVDTAFYGGWYDYRSAVSDITQGLDQITELHELGKTVNDRLVKTLQLEDACIFLRDLKANFPSSRLLSRQDPPSRVWGDSKPCRRTACPTC